LIVRILALVLALLLVGGVAQAYEAPVIEDPIVEVALVAAPKIAAPDVRPVVFAPGPMQSAGRAHVSSIDRPPR
jgi:hypothetical protein